MTMDSRHGHPERADHARDSRSRGRGLAGCSRAQPSPPARRCRAASRRAERDPADLVLLDVMLPGIDGLEVTAEPGNSQPDHARGCASRGRGLPFLGGRADCPSSFLRQLQLLKESPALVHLYMDAVSYTHLRAHETVLDLVCR